MIYLDNGATTFPKPECVYKALDEANRTLAFNAGRGSYKQAKTVSNMIDETRSQIADLVHLSGDTVSFESSATEALNIIINGLDLNDGDTVYISPFEHNAIVRPLYNRKKDIDFSIKLLPFDQNTWGFDSHEATNLFALNKPKAVFVSHISNVTGYVLPYEEIFSLAKQYDSINVLDCSQSFGVLNPDVEDTDFVVFAGHKSLYASFGVAGFINVSSKGLRVTKSGGTGSDSLNHDMPETGNGRYESGSLNSVAVAGLHASLQWLKEHDVFSHEKEITKYAIDKLSELEKIKLYLPENIESIVGIISLTVSGYLSSDVGTILSDEFDICVRTGYHCSPFIHSFLGSLKSNGTVRIGIGAFTKKDDIDQLVNALKTL